MEHLFENLRHSLNSNGRKGKLRFEYILGICWLLVLFSSAEAAILSKGPYIIIPSQDDAIKVLWQTDSTPEISKIEWGETTSYPYSSGALLESASGENRHQFTYTIADGTLIEAFEINKRGVVCPGFGDGKQVGSLLRSDLDEASGIAASRMNAGVFWVHNDYPDAHPEDANKIYAINSTGTVLGTYEISVSPGARDPEDIAVGPGPQAGENNPATGNYIYWGDIGDNSNQYSDIRIKRIPEPLVDFELAPMNKTLGQEDGVDVIRLQYPSGEHAPSHKDSEALMVDPLTGDIYVVTKRMAPNKVYRAPYPQSTLDVITMEYVATLSEETALNWITGGDISPDGSLVVLKNDGSADYASIWYRDNGVSIGDLLHLKPCTFQIQPEPQGEAIGFDPQGEGFYTVSEAHNASEPIWYYPLTGLSPNETYYVRVKAISDSGTVYGSGVRFSTSIAVPIVTTNPIFLITHRNAQSGGNIASDGGAAITARGACCCKVFFQNETIHLPVLRNFCEYDTEV